MSAAPGWYDAGTPGRVRWWDGTQWTAHEAPAPAAPEAATPEAVSPGAAAPRPAAPAVPGIAAMPTGIPPGWYPTPAGPIRWWDGRIWTGSRVKDGRPGIDWSTTEQVGVAWAIGGAFLAIGLVQLTLALVSPGLSWVVVLTLAVAALWFAIAAQTARVRRIPAPTGAPLDIDAVRPSPADVEGPGAGWYPLTGTMSRWWTGSRWTAYTLTRFGIRPTFHAAQAVKTLRWMSVGVFALASAVAAAGVVFLVVGGNDVRALATVIGWVLIAGGVCFALVGLVSLLLTRAQTRLLLLPDAPPRG